LDVGARKIVLEKTERTDFKSPELPE